MSHTLTSLIIYIAWFSIILLTLGLFRSYLTLSGQRAPNKYSPTGTDVSPDRGVTVARGTLVGGDVRVGAGVGGSSVGSGVAVAWGAVVGCVPFVTWRGVGVMEGVGVGGGASKRRSGHRQCDRHPV